MYLPGVTVLLQVYHHVVLDVSAQGENPSTTTSPYCTLLYLSVRGHNPSTSTSPYCTLRLCPGSQSFNKYITILYYTSLSRVTIPLQVHHHTVLYDSARGHNHSTSTSPHYTQRLCQHHHTVSYVSARGHNHSTSTSPYCTRCICPGSQSFHKYITMLYFRSLPGVTILLQVHHHTVLYVSARCHNPSTSTTPFCTLGLCPGSQSFYKCITIRYFTSLPGIRIPLQIHHHTVLYVSARGHNPSTNTSPYCTSRPCPGAQSFNKYITILYFTSLSGVTIILQVHLHTVLYVSARGHNPSTSISPYCVLRLCPGGHNPSASKPASSTLRLCPGSQSFYKYITILYLMSLHGVTIILQVHHHTVLYVSVRVTNPLQVHRHAVRYVSARFHNYSTSTSPYCTLCICPGSQSLYKCIMMLYFASLSGVTFFLQVNHHTVHYVSARGQNPPTITSPYCTSRLCSGSQSFYKYIIILYITSLPGVTILLQVHHHTLLYVSARDHNPSTSTSPYCTFRLCPGSQSINKYITILYYTSLPGVTILLQVHHHTVLYVSARNHNLSTSTSPYCTLRLCPWSQPLYKYIMMLYFASLPGVTIPLQVHHHTVLYVSARGHNPSTSASPYGTLRICPGSQSFYKYITILYFTSLPRVTIILQVHHHTVLYISARVHNLSTSTSPYCMLRLCPGSQSFYKYITILYYTSLPRVTMLLQVHHQAVLYVCDQGHNPSTSTSPYCTLRLCPGSETFYKYITMLYVTSLPGFTIILQVHHHTVLYVSARGHNPSTSTSPYCTLRLCPGSQSFYNYITILYFTSLPGITISL